MWAPNGALSMTARTACSLRAISSMPASARSRAPVRSWANSTMATAVMTMKSVSQMARTQAVWTSAGSGSRPDVLRVGDDEHRDHADAGEDQARPPAEHHAPQPRPAR